MKTNILRKGLHFLLYSIIAGSLKSEDEQSTWRTNEEVGKVIKQYVDANYERIVREQEERFGIKFVSVPKYDFNGEGDGQEGEYFPENGTITFYFGDTWEPNEGHAQWLTEEQKTSRDIQKGVEITARHELGHDYFVERTEALGRRKYWLTDRETQEQTRIEIQLNEGVAEYMQVQGMQGEVFIKDNYKNMPIVQPILSIDFRRGVDCIIMNPPLPKEVSDSKAYQQRITNLLEQNKCK